MLNVKKLLVSTLIISTITLSNSAIAFSKNSIPQDTKIQYASSLGSFDSSVDSWGKIKWANYDSECYYEVSVRDTDCTDPDESLILDHADGGGGSRRYFDYAINDRRLINGHRYRVWIGAYDRNKKLVAESFAYFRFLR